MDADATAGVEESSAKRARRDAGGASSIAPPPSEPSDGVASSSAPSAASTALGMSSFEAGEDVDLEPVASLPRELLSQIFSLLDLADRSRASHVCRRWRAAALEPPHSSNLSLRLRHVWLYGRLKDEFQTRHTRKPWPEKAWAPDPTALKETGLLLALRSPLAVGLEKLNVTLGRATGPPVVEEDDRRIRAALGRPAGPRKAGRASFRSWPLRPLMEALPSSVTSLEVVLDDVTQMRLDSILFDKEQERIMQQLDRLQELAPQLRELVLHNTMASRARWVPRHAGLERLDAGGLSCGPRALLANVPSVQRLATLDLFNEDMPGEEQRRALAALAERGLRVRSLDLTGVDLSQEGVVDAVSAIFRPKEVGFGSGPATLKLAINPLPDGGLPDGFGAGAERISSSGTPRRTVLPWLSAVTRGPSLQLLEFRQGARAFGEDFTSPRELLSALQGCREGLKIDLYWPVELDTRSGWDAMDGLAFVCDFLIRDRALLHAVSIDPTFNRQFHLNSFPHRGLAAHSRYRVERMDVLAAHGELDVNEVRDFLFSAGHAHRTLKEALAPATEEARLLAQAREALSAELQGQDWAEAVREELALYEALERRARAHLPEGVKPLTMPLFLTQYDSDG